MVQLHLNYMKMLYCKVLALIFIVCVIRRGNGTATPELYEGSTTRDTETEAPINKSVKNFTYTYKRKVLNVSFVPTFVGYEYTIALIKKGELLPYRSKSLFNVKPYVYQVFKRHDVITNENYFIKIYDDDRNGEPFTSELVCLVGYKTSDLDCNICTFDIGFRDETREASISPYFELPPEYASCFAEYTIELCIVIENDPRSNLWKDCTPIQTKNVTHSNEISVTFDNLPPNNYCINIFAHHQYCPTNGICNLGRSIVKELIEYKEDKVPTLKKKHNATVLIAITVSSSVVVIIIIILVWKRRKLVKVYFPEYLSTIRIQNAEVSSVNEREEAHERKLTAPILYAQSCKIEQNVVVSLHEFLKECCHVNSIIGEDNPEVLINSAGWILANYKYEESKNYDQSCKTEQNEVVAQNEFLKECYPVESITEEESGSEVLANNATRIQKNYKNEDPKHARKIIILETDAALRWYQFWCSLGKIPKPEYRGSSHLDDLFVYGFNLLASNRKLLEADNRNIVVIRFDYSLDSNEIDCFQQKKLHLPHHLVELYNSLWDKEDLQSEKENLLNNWKEKPSFKNLETAIIEMKEYVRQNPEYLDRCVFV